MTRRSGRVGVLEEGLVTDAVKREQDRACQILDPSLREERTYQHSAMAASLHARCEVGRVGGWKGGPTAAAAAGLGAGSSC